MFCAFTECGVLDPGTEHSAAEDAENLELNTQPETWN